MIPKKLIVLKSLVTLLQSRQFLTFVCVGGSSTLLQFILLFVLVEWLVINKVIASATGYLLSSIYNYLLNYYFTFNHSGGHWQTLPKFGIVVLIGVVVNSIIFYWFSYFMPYLIAQIFAVGATLIVNFLLHKFWIYRRP